MHVCSYTHEPMTFDPGFVNTTIYGDRVESGWSWFPYSQNTDAFWAKVPSLLWLCPLRMLLLPIFPPLRMLMCPPAPLRMLLCPPCHHMA